LIAASDIRHALGQLNAGVPESKIWAGLVEAFKTPLQDKATLQQAQFAQSMGIGLAPMLRHLLEQLEFQKRAAAQIAVAVRGPAFTAKIIHWLPWISLVLAQILRINALGYLISTIWGWLILGLAAGLGLAAATTTRKMLNRAAEPVSDAGLQYRLMAVALKAGVGLPRALTVMAAIGIGGVEELVGFCRVALQGSLNLADQLTAQALELQNQALDVKLSELQVLPIKMLTPIAALLIPQFLLLLVVPQVLATVAAYI
jgi:hypothetical protein